VFPVYNSPGSSNSLMLCCRGSATL